jgi:hypothetical protein
LLRARAPWVRCHLGGLRGEAVVIGVADKFDGLRWGDRDGGEGEELDELVCIADDRLQLGVGEHAA